MIMTICTHTTDCGPLGEVELTVSYRYAKGRRATQIDPAEPEHAYVNWIKVGGINGVEVEVSDDYIEAEIVPHCIADWHGETLTKLTAITKIKEYKQ